MVKHLSAHSPVTIVQQMRRREDAVLKLPGQISNLLSHPPTRSGVESGMRAVVLVVLLVVSCSQSNPAADTSNSSPTPAATPSQTTTTPTETIEQLLDRCPSPAELAAVDSSVSMTFTSDPSAGRLVCRAAQGSRDLTLLQERAYQAVLMFTWIHFDTPLPWTNLPLDTWLAHAIHGVDFRSDSQYSYCCLPGGVIAIQAKDLAVLSESIPIWDSVRWLAALFIHEARHNEGYVHTCSTGDRAGQNDNTIAELGSWGVEYYFLLWLGRHSDPAIVPESFRLAARRDAESMPARFFCNPPPTPTG
jgi:hypothetical protein